MSDEIAVKRPYEIAMAEMRGRAQVDKSDGFAVAAAVADKISTAEDIDAVIDAAESGPGGLGDLEGKPFRFLGGSLRWAEAAEKYREGGAGVFAVFTAVTSGGSEVTVSTGAVNVVFQLRRFEKLGVFGSEGELYPYDFTVRSRETANGTLYRISRAG